MADIWQWKGDDSDGAGYTRILSGSSSVPITGTVTLASGSATIGVISGTVTLASGSATIGVVSGNVTLAGSKLAVSMANGDDTLNVAASANATITITPPADELWRVKLIRLNIPAVGTSGSHDVTIGVGAAGADRASITLAATFSAAVTLAYNQPGSGVSSKTPATDTEIQRAILNLVVTNASPLVFYYQNNTNTTQGGALVLRVIKEVEYIVS